jgi:hypothetical protein
MPDVLQSRKSDKAPHQTAGANGVPNGIVPDTFFIR